MQRFYTVALAKAHGMVPETILLLRAWQPGMSAIGLRDKVLAEGLLPRATAARVSDIVLRSFGPRYLKDGGTTAQRLKLLVEAGLATHKLAQLFLLATARANTILHDFLREVYWPRYHAGAAVLQRQDAEDFLRTAHAVGKVPNRWSEAGEVHVSRALLGCLTDFGLARDLAQGRREVLPFNPWASTVLYLAHELHFGGAGDTTILEHSDWALFGLDRYGVLQELRRAAAAGHFIVQYAGDLLRISWKYRSMEECLNAIAAEG